GLPVAGAHQVEKRTLDGVEVDVMSADWQLQVRGDCWPVHEPNLAEDFARVGDGRSLQEFNDRYGLLGYHRLHEVEMLHRNETWQGDPVPWALAHARIAAGILEAVRIIDQVREGKPKLTVQQVPFLLRTFFGEFKKMGLSVKHERNASS